jgi:ribosomal protein S18 acetylase RimI-like enzyme
MAANPCAATAPASCRLRKPKKWRLTSTAVATAHQSEGIGRRLVAAIADQLVRSEFDSVLVWVVAGNPARFFYRRLGGQQIAERRERFAGADVDQVAFGWLDIRRSIVPAGRAAGP